MSLSCILIFDQKTAVWAVKYIVFKNNYLSIILVESHLFFFIMHVWNILFQGTFMVTRCKSEGTETWNHCEAKEVQYQPKSYLFVSLDFTNHKKWWTISSYILYINELISVHLYIIPDFQWWTIELKAFSSQHYNCLTAPAMLLT